ncbi:hypothetical protein GCM10023322_42200 [Rugosimonospora acidiphila]|uniref:Lipoprotein n=1 Tax=Rugosimonospora acidiphila TaxID=556531 RepID=A0ABP9S0M3_9ACTN
MTGRTIVTVRRALTLLLAGCCLTACSHRSAPRAAPSLGAAAATAASDGPALSPTPSPTLPPPPPPPPLSSSQPGQAGFADDTAVSCAGQPSADQVIGKVRGAGLVTGDTKLTVQLGPLCAGSWQYTIFEVADREPLQVVTEGQPSALTLVTAGTDVCSTVVFGQAPPGIINVAQCGQAMPPG